ncbi:MAG TPA: FAD-binding oxidoreductase [Stellaceae bacterium]|jgi:D-amino-acid dehydrogenase|nr:FAD-binding oxidoreductase [Stellaceae bacterium]
MAVDTPRRVGVIGAGMVGVCTASWLQRDGHSVFLVDPGTPGEGASFGNAGCFNGSSVTPMAMPGVIRKLPHWLMDPLGPLSLRWSYLPQIMPYLIRFVRSSTPEKVRAQAKALRPLVGPTLPLVRDLAKEAGADDLVHQRGHLYVYRSAEALAKDDFAWALRRENGVVVDEFDADELRQLEPALSREYTRGLLVRENGHTSNPFALVTRLVEQFRRNGGEIVQARATGFRLDGSRLAAIRSDTGELPADAAIICAGAHSKPLAAALGDRVLLETERGYHLMISNPETTLGIPTADADGKFVATPMELGIRFAGTVELAGLDAPPDWRRARLLLDQGRKMLPGLAGDYADGRLSMWMGHRPSMPDSLPALGRSKASPDVIYAFGHGHVGMTAAPMTGKIVADLVAGRPAPIDIAPFDPGRFAR